MIQGERALMYRRLRRRAGMVPLRRPARRQEGHRLGALFISGDHPRRRQASRSSLPCQAVLSHLLLRRGRSFQRDCSLQVSCLQSVRTVTASGWSIDMAVAHREQVAGNRSQCPFRARERTRRREALQSDGNCGQQLLRGTCMLDRAVPNICLSLLHHHSRQRTTLTKEARH